MRSCRTVIAIRDDSKRVKKMGFLRICHTVVLATEKRQSRRTERMPNNQPYLPRPGMDERAIVAEMRRDQHSLLWDECRNFVKLCVNTRAKNIPIDHQEDIVQEIMYKITRSLEHFRFDSTLKAWVNVIVERCIIDEHRKLQNEVPYQFHLATSPDESDYEGEEPGTSEEKSAEEAYITSDEIDKGWAACLEYARTHANPIRNQLILRMVMLEGHSHAAAAKEAGCSSAVVGYVVREAQKYARKKTDHRK